MLPIKRRLPLSTAIPRISKLESHYIVLNQCRSFRTIPPQNEKQTQEKPIPPPPSALEGAPRSHGKRVYKFTPKPLDRPMGLPSPPHIGENSGIDRRTWRQRFNDYCDRDKHRAKHQKIVAAFAKPYFREYNNIVKHHEGKSFLAPPGVFKSERALYFPNLYGQTLLKANKFRDTTPLFQNRVSIVSIYSNLGAENQAKSLVAQENNPDLHEIVNRNSDIAQFVNINMETNSLKAWIIRRFLGSLRKQFEKKNWGRYFLVTRGLEVEISDTIGLLNSKVGYTYLLDGECKIRWACSGPASEEEKLGVVKSVRLLIRETQKRKEETTPSKRQPEPESAAPSSIKVEAA